jgi:hypothetical protein
MALSSQMSRSLTELMGSERIVIGFSEDLHDGDTVRVYVEDVTRADALPVTLAGHVVHYVDVGVPDKIARTQSARAVDVDRRTKQSVEDGADASDFIATLVASADDAYCVEWAFEVIDGSAKYERELDAIGPVSGLRMAKRDELAQKSGRATKVTTGGRITDVAATIQIGSDTYRDQLLVETSSVFAAGGDSGSVLIAESDLAAVGVIMATNVPHGTRTWANQIGLVQVPLGVQAAA